jgi:hypothetical protein
MLKKSRIHALVDRADHNCRLTPPSPRPCQAWHGNRVTGVHHKEVGLSADGLASAPPSWAAAGRLHVEVRMERLKMFIV